MNKLYQQQKTQLNTKINELNQIILELNNINTSLTSQNAATQKNTLYNLYDKKKDSYKLLNNADKLIIDIIKIITDTNNYYGIEQINTLNFNIDEIEKPAKFNSSENIQLIDSLLNKIKDNIERINKKELIKEINKQIK